jgi:O-antigen/teichoic acid export membrane protein
MESTLQVERTANTTLQSSRVERTRRLKRTFVSSLLLRPLAIITPFVIAPMFVKYLGQERYGIYETVISFAGFIAMSNAGLTLGLINKLTDCHVS